MIVDVIQFLAIILLAVVHIRHVRKTRLRLTVGDLRRAERLQSWFNGHNKL